MLLSFKHYSEILSGSFYYLNRYPKILFFQKKVLALKIVTAL